MCCSGNSLQYIAKIFAKVYTVCKIINCTHPIKLLYFETWLGGQIYGQNG